MPTVYNGTGTWYYGKRRIHRAKGTCGFCHAVGELESYDTTLFFVVVMVPLIPIGKKRIIEQCPRCQQHRLLSLAKWESAKSADIEEVLEKLKQNPDRKEHVQAAVACAVSYQDGVLFDKIADTLASRLTDADVQAQLGDGYEYFTRWNEAESAYRAALAIADRPEVRERLGFVLARQGRPDEAIPYLRHILDGRLQDKAGYIFLLVEAYQMQGRHDDALKLMDQRDAAFSDLIAEKDYVKQRSFSEYNRDTGKPLKASLLKESGKEGYREGNWTAKIPWLIGPAVIVGLLGWYLIAAWMAGQNHEVFLVNGWTIPYTVAVNGQEHRLLPASVQSIRLPEGEVAVEFRDPALAREPIHVRIETDFFKRPFVQSTTVINPDRMAVIEWEETEYTEQPQDVINQGHFHLGDAQYSFESIDYRFVPFPDKLQMKQGSRIRKTRVGLAATPTPEARVRRVMQVPDKASQIAYHKQWLQLDPNDVISLSSLLLLLPDDEGIAFVKPRLADRPIKLDWHRAYQSLMERAFPQVDLRAEYQKLSAELPNHADALYLLARVMDIDESEPALRKSATMVPPSAYAMSALGYQAVAQGNFPEALQWTTKAVAMDGKNLTFAMVHRWALLANRRYEEVLELSRKSRGNASGDLTLTIEEINMYSAMGEKDNVRKTIERAVQSLPASAKPMMEAMLESLVCVAENDVKGFLERVDHIPQYPPFYAALLRGKLDEAGAALEQNTTPDTAFMQSALLYLAAVKAKNNRWADSQWKSLLERLAKDEREEREFGDVLAARKPVNVDRLARLPMDPAKKRVVLAVAAQRFPQHRDKLLVLSERLCLESDVVVLCLRSLR